MAAIKNVIWTPQPKQKLFMSLPDFIALYGGAAGGGKSDALVMEATRQVNNPMYQGLIVRKTFPELEEIINRSNELYPRIFPGCKYNATAHRWTFKSGAKIYFGSLQHKKDRIKYQGEQYQFIGIDEATHFLLEEKDFLVSRCRARGPGQVCYVRLTANPGGPGHGWVKQQFVDNGPNKRTFFIYEIDDPTTGKKIRTVRSSMYVPATVFDNKKLLENDPGYITTLAGLNERDRNALLYGNWEIFSGQAFTEFRNDPNHYKDRRYTHVIEPFNIPDYWNVYRSYDYGYSRPFSVGWYAISPDGAIYRVRELYGWNGTPNEGIKWDVGRQAEEVKKMEEQDELLKRHKIYGIADPAIFAADGGVSVADTFMKHGIYFEKADHQRIAGKQQCHYRLAFDNNGFPGFQVFTNCKNFIRTIPTIPLDETNYEDIDSKSEDHIYDEWRYLLMDNPITPRYTPQIERSYNPLDTPIRHTQTDWARRLVI